MLGPEVVTPCLQELLAMIQDLVLEPAEFTSAETTRCRQDYWIKPELGQGSGLLDVDVSRLGPLVAVEEEPRGADARDRRHLRRCYRTWAVHDGRGGPPGLVDDRSSIRAARRRAARRRASAAAAGQAVREPATLSRGPSDITPSAPRTRGRTRRRSWRRRRGRTPPRSRGRSVRSPCLVVDRFWTESARRPACPTLWPLSGGPSAARPLRRLVRPALRHTRSSFGGREP